MQDLVRNSYEKNYSRELRGAFGQDMSVSQYPEDCGSENVVRVVLVNPNFEASLTKAVEELSAAKLRLEKLGFSSSADTSQQCSLSTLDSLEIEQPMLSDELTVLINDIKIAMKSLQYASYRVKIYKKDNRSRFTFSYKCEPRAFVNSLATNEFFKSRLLKEMKKVIDLLGDPYCELFQPLTVDYDLIEVNGNSCWSIKRRKFVDGAITDELIGKISPRAFCPYNPETPPKPKYFREILDNSLDESEVAIFCHDFLNLLKYNQKRHKDKVPCLVGDANSGKTSLFFPILGLVHHGNVATVTKQRAFNKSMISPFTEVIFIDEATESTMEISDWILTQRGYTAHDVKYQNARAFINKCPMLITCQKKLEFGATDQLAMVRRLRTYTFRSLPRTNRKASAWLKRHAMDCVVWAAEKARVPEGDADGESCDDGASSSDQEESDSLEGALLEEEKKEIQSLSLSALLTADEPMRDAVAEEFLHDGDEEEEEVCLSDNSSVTEDDRVGILKERLEKSRPGSLRERQISHMLEIEEKARVREARRRRERLEGRRSMLKRKGVSSQNLQLLSNDPSAPLPIPVVEELERFDDEQESAQRNARVEKARLAYQNEWLRNTEIELQECSEKLENAREPYMRNGLQAYIEVLVDKLCNHYRGSGMLNTAEAVEERRRVCCALGLLR